MRQLLIALFLLMAAASCSKKDTETAVNSTDTSAATDTVQTPDSVNLITNVYYSDVNSDDTTDFVSSAIQDTIYYNSDLQIVKIVSKISATDSIVSDYTYNSNGKISKVNVYNNFANRWTIFDVYFYYDSENKLDSMIRSREDEVISYKFGYDANNRLVSSYSYYIKAYYSNYEDGDPNAEETYYWNTSGSLDSVATGLFSGYSEGTGFDIKTLGIPSGSPVIAADAVDPAYMFKLAWQSDSYFLDMYINGYWHQFVNPDVAVITNGTYTYDYTDVQYYPGSYSVTAVMNVDNTVRWLVRKNIKNSAASAVRGIQKFEYMRVAKP